MKPRTTCELCNGEAALHCESDSAFLCWACDARVHGANFLVARHARRLLCLECGSFHADHHPLYGPGFLPYLSLCPSCHDITHKDNDDDDDDDGISSFSDSDSSACSSSSLPSSMSSSCVSSAESMAQPHGREGVIGIAAVPANGDGPIKAGRSPGAATESECSNPGRTRQRRRSRRAAARDGLDARADAILINWCRRLGLEGCCALGAASHALSLGTRKMVAVPFRVCVAAAVWFAAKRCCAEAAGGGRRAAAVLRRLEALSGVPGKLIVIAEVQLSRAVRRCDTEEGREGWAECS